MKRKGSYTLLMCIILACASATFVACGKKDKCAEGHTYDVNMVCTVCGYSPYTKGLSYLLKKDRKSYAVVGLSTRDEIEIRIPPTYQGLPVTEISDQAFARQYNITSITIPQSVTSIAAGMFDECDSLREITVESGNPKYHSAGNCIIETETKTLIAGCKNSIIPDDGSVTGIGEDAFYGCKNLTSITIPQDVTSIGDSAFRDCSKLTSITIPNSVISIGSLAFDECTNLTSIEIPQSVTSIGGGAFSFCDCLTIYCEAENAPSGFADDWNFSCPVVWNCKNNDKDKDGYAYAIIDGVRYSLKDGIATVIRQPNDLSGSVTIPSSVPYKSESYTVTSIESFAFEGCALSDIGLPSSIMSIYLGAFRNCGYLSAVTIPQSVTAIGSGLFYGCDSLCELTVASGNATYHSAGNCIIETATKTLIAGCQNSIVPDDGSVTSIGEDAFYGCKNLSAITIPQGVMSIGDSAFSWCSSLTSITIPQGVTSIGDWAFRESRLTSVTIPNSVTSIGGHAFSGCRSLGEITIPNSVTSIGDWAFSGCENLSAIMLPQRITSIGDETFSGCRKLTSITIPQGVTSIGESAFDGCSKLTSVTIPQDVTSIGFRAFRNCSSLTGITYGGTKAQWKAIEKYRWNFNTGNYTVTCTDGTLPKSESE